MKLSFETFSHTIGYEIDRKSIRIFFKFWLLYFLQDNVRYFHYSYFVLDGIGCLEVNECFLKPLSLSLANVSGMLETATHALTKLRAYKVSSIWLIGSNRFILRLDFVDCRFHSHCQPYKTVCHTIAAGTIFS